MEDKELSCDKDRARLRCEKLRCGAMPEKDDVVLVSWECPTAGGSVEDGWLELFTQLPPAATSPSDRSGGAL